MCHSRVKIKEPLDNKLVMHANKDFEGVYNKLVVFKLGKWRATGFDGFQESGLFQTY